MKILGWWKVEPMPGAHYASMYGVPCYFVDSGEGCMLAGRNRLYDWLLTIVPHLHNYLVAPFYDSGFPIKVGARVDGKE